MLSNNRVLSTILLLLFVYLSFFCEIFANNYDESKYVLENNQLRNISTDAVVEGSVASGGLQPNYIIDWNNNAFDEIRKFSQKTKQSSKPYLEKLNEIQNFIKKKVFKDTDYTNRKYLALMSKYRANKKDIPLSEYVKTKNGVCREHALVTHLALKEAGIPNSYLYVTAQIDDRVEDHAVNIIDYNGEKWIIDSYSKNFHGMNLNDIKKGVKKPRYLPLKNVLLTRDFSAKFKRRQFLKFNDFPKVWNPRLNVDEIIEKNHHLKIEIRNCLSQMLN